MKMKLKVEVVSRESIKPSSPTPHHLRTFKLSFFDQLAAPAVYAPLVLFYNHSDNPGINNDKDDDNKVIKEASSSSAFNHGLMKKSLSETLTRYYPMAGRMQDDSCSVVDCNDDGVEYVEARVLSSDNHNNIRLSDVIRNPDIHLLVDQFVPYEPTDFNYSKPLLSVQVNIFECGGVVIGGQISHKIADGSSFITFVKDWAATSRCRSGNTTTIPPLELLPTLFPQIDLRSLGFASFTGTKRDEILTKRFVFETSKIDELKQRSVTTVNGGLDDDNHPEYPTRVEALSAFIWERFIDVFDKAKDRQRAGGGGSGGVRVYGLSHSVNMRTRMKPPLPADTFGNLGCISIGLSHCAEGKKDPYPVLVGKVKDTIKKIDDEHAKKLRTRDGPIHYMKYLEEISSSCNVILTFTSLCRFPLYEADFGWGNPEWVSIATFPFKNTVALIDTRSRDGIEAWVHLTKEDMAQFERDEELLSFVS